MSRYRQVRVGKGEMRRRFREAGLEAPEANGYVVIPGDKGPAGPGAPPDCSHSQIIVYLDSQGHEAARALIFLKPDESLGASQKPDPTRVLIGRTLYILDREQPTIGHRRSGRRRRRERDR